MSTMDARAAEIHADNVAAGWWTDLNTGERLDRNMGELLMLCVTEVSEAHGGFLLACADDKLPHRPMLEVELADVVIRLYDIAGSREMDLESHAFTSASLKANMYLGGVQAQLMGVVDSLSSAMEAHRKSDEYRLSSSIYCAILRCYVIAADQSLDIPGAIEEKRAFNRARLDHKLENRRAAGGKRC